MLVRAAGPGRSGLSRGKRLAVKRIKSSNGPMFHVVLFRPLIPQNTGNIGRMCAVTRSRLHLIHPLGFAVTDRNLKRAGMDYWRSLDVHHHDDWAAFKASPAAPRRLWLFTTHATRTFWEVTYSADDGLVFGNEEAGAPDWLHAELTEAQRIKIPHANAGLRSLNLSTAAGIATYEAIRQSGGWGATTGSA